MNMPESVTSIGSARLLGIPLPIMLLALVAISAHILLTRTPFGRQLYAVGNNAAGARIAGINVTLILVGAYALCGACAALSGLISLTQTGAVSPSFGDKKEFLAIAAAVLGGTSLFGGRGTVLPGTLLGALLVQAVENGLVIINADPYIYPIITSSIIFLAVLLDSFRGRALTKLGRRMIRVEPAQ
ncbi:MAG: ribose transport system permease protein [Verrucomicrobiales bacterium]|jgi:ribose transport system permease protein